MLLTLGVVITLAGAAIISRLQAPGSVKASSLGWMSEQ